MSNRCRTIVTKVYYGTPVTSDRLKTVERFVYQYSSDEDQNLIASPDTLTEPTSNTNAPGVIIQPDDVSLPENRDIDDSLEAALETTLHPEEPQATTDHEAEVHLELEESTDEPHAPNRSVDLNTTNELFSSPLKYISPERDRSRPGLNASGKETAQCEWCKLYYEAAHGIKVHKSRCSSRIT